MRRQTEEALKPLASQDGAAAFDEAWQAEVLAIADALVQNGMFTATRWSQALGIALRQAEADGAADDQQTYYQCVLSALETLIVEHSEIDQSSMDRMRHDWELAYLATPHGQPVKLD